MYENFLLLRKVVFDCWHLPIACTCIFPLKETDTGRGVAENKLLYLIIYSAKDIIFDKWIWVICSMIDKFI